MERSPETYDEWIRKSKMLNAIERLMQTRNAYAISVCRYIAMGYEGRSPIRRGARIALAADQGEKKAMLKYLKGEF